MEEMPDSTCRSEQFNRVECDCNCTTCDEDTCVCACHYVQSME